MTVLKVKPCTSITEMDASLGGYFEYDDTWHVIGRAQQSLSIIRDEDDSLIAILRRGMIDINLTQLAVQSYLSVGKMVSSNRGYAAGLKARSKTHNRYEKGLNSNSGIMGFIDNTNLSRPCRMTQFTKSHFKDFTAGLPFIKRIDACFKEVLPIAHDRQLQEANKTEYHIDDTAFSTVTVNYNFRTALHKDSGDFRQGFGNLVVCSEGVKGGLLLFPRYKVAIELCTGDFLAMDVHEYHCNSSILPIDENGFRLSFVCYLRERMANCEKNNTIIRMLNGGTKKSTDWVKDIFTFYGEDLPQRQVTGVGPSGHEWWQCSGQNIILTYKNKRYTLVDIVNNTKVHELGRAWKYAYDYFMRQKSQSQEEPCSYQAQ